MVKPLQEFTGAFYAKVAVLCFGVGAGIETFMVNTGFYDMCVGRAVTPRSRCWKRSPLPAGRELDVTRFVAACVLLAVSLQTPQPRPWRQNPKAGWPVLQRDPLGDGAAAREPGVQKGVRSDEGCGADELAGAGAA
jgi:hypothetical protein